MPEENKPVRNPKEEADKIYAAYLNDRYTVVEIDGVKYIALSELAEKRVEWFPRSEEPKEWL